ncbi:MAG: homoserine dehydrogenase [Gammaproteobacteria bacterium]|nr:MAG: homoserine dehydrogenase [Gammaproteobacteria bacterium]TDJ43148.1 MAG: homoserine dehydrogenase [Gammaproteobacteria bacterium]
MEPLRVGLCGLGTVGQGVVELLARNASSIARRAGRSVIITRVASRTPKPEVDLAGATFSTRLDDVVRASDVDVVVETMGGEAAARQLMSDSCGAAKHFVTANKALIALHGQELLAAARNAGVMVRFEAAVAGGIPIVKALSEGLAGNRIHWIAGIINGTSNYILSAMASDGASFADALASAQALGYAEADPAFDVDGIDAAHKLSILSALAFDTPLQFDAVYTEGIGAITAEDIEYAAALGYRIKHLGITRRTSAGIEMRVHPTLVPETRLLSRVDGVTNAVVIHSDAVGASLYCGPGAGALPSASAVVADLIDVARGNALPAFGQDPAPARVPIDDIESAYYLRIPAADQPGVMARVAQILSSKEISIESVIQREQAIRADTGTAWVPVIILTHRVIERDLNQALREIQQLDDVVDTITRIRVETLDADG